MKLIPNWAKIPINKTVVKDTGFCKYSAIRYAMVTPASINMESAMLSAMTSL